MANLIITNRCSAACDFCFASETRSRSLQNGLIQMDEAEFRSYLDLILASGIKELRLLGGEPTIHPLFPRFVELGREAGCSVTVFSNGVMPEAAIRTLTALDPEVCNVVINLTAALHGDDLSARMRTLRALGPRAQLGMTLTSPDFSLYACVASIKIFDLKQTVRIGLAHPVWQGVNRSVHPKRYAAIGRTLLEQSFFAARYGITLEADCGFVRCMFGDRFDQLLQNGFRYSSTCTPVLDLCTGGTIFPCFALSALLTADRRSFPDVQAARSYFDARLKPLHSIGVYPECTDCPYFETEECCGGCLAARLCRIRPLKEVGR